MAETPSPPTPPSVIPALDPIRGLAAIWVLATHTSTDRLTVPGGAFAVDLFMLVSGFLMVHQALLRRHREPIGSWPMVRSFWLRRYFRIAPLYYVMVAVYFFHWWEYVKTAPPGPLANAFWHTSFLFGFVDDGAGPSGVMDWSIALEMQFYLVFPWLFLLMEKFGIILFGLGCFLITWLANNWIGVYVGDSPGLWGKVWHAPSLLPLMLVLFSLGMSAAWLWWKRPRPGFHWAALGGLALCSIFAFERPHAWVALLGLATPCLLRFHPFTAGVIDTGLRWFNNFAANRLWHCLAEWSYGVYLCHYMVQSILRPYVESYHLSRWSEWLTLFASTLGVSLLVAAISHRFIEKPAVRLGKYVVRRLAGD